MEMVMKQLRWSTQEFNELSNEQLYAILALRQEVFVVEQHCAYQDADGEDQAAIHLTAWHDDALVAYARIFHATGKRPLKKANLHGADGEVHRIGRVIIKAESRGQQLGRELMQRAMHIALNNPISEQIVIGAQTYLLNFYRSLGFVCEGEAYLEDGIPHQDMRYIGPSPWHEEANTSTARPASMTPLVAADPELAPAAAALAAELGLPQEDQQEPFILELTAQGLQLRWKAEPKVTPLLLDFVGGKQGWRRQAGGIRDEAIVRAFGIQKGHRPDILDATAGLGRDAMVLAHAGCSVRLLERQPSIHALLSDAVYRASHDPDIGEWVSGRVRVLAAGSILQPAYTNQLAHKPPMAIYLDPMFPHRDKSAAVKKDMQMLQALVGDDDDSDALLPIALSLATHRVVVKRPAKAPYLNQQAPQSQVTTKKHRFDVYIKQAY